MRKAYIISDNVVTSLGFSTSECMDAIVGGVCGVKPFSGDMPDVEPFAASQVDGERLAAELERNNVAGELTRFEQLAVLAVQGALKGLDISNDRTAIILSTTKGNVGLLAENANDPRLNLWHSAQVVADYFGNKSKPIVISNACISGVAAVVVASRMIESGQYDNVVVVGADELTKFVVSGFQSFKALSPEPCKPFDKDRCGLNIGEGAAAVVLGVCDGAGGSKACEDAAVSGACQDAADCSVATACYATAGRITIDAGAITNDANHISGPSRTGEGLYLALKQVCGDEKPDFINAHGTATPYNDEMEAIAFSRAGFDGVPVNSLKGYMGHTLGAAGVIEIALCAEAMRRGVIPASMGFAESGVTVPINIAREAHEKEIRTVIKTASGFGGCNAAVKLRKN